MAKKTAPKAEKPVLAIPSPHRISGDVDAMLEATISERFQKIALIKTSEKGDTGGIWVVDRKPSNADPKELVSVLNTEQLGHLVRYVCSLANAWSSGIGMSGDGSCLYIKKHTDTVYKVLPQLREYDLFLIPAGRSGCAKYRISVQDLVSQILSRAKTIQDNLDKFGVMAGKERTHKSDDAPTITFEF